MIHKGISSKDYHFTNIKHSQISEKLFCYYFSINLLKNLQIVQDYISDIQTIFIIRHDPE